MKTNAPAPRLGPHAVGIAATLAGLAVATGAFGAHGLKARLGPEQLAWWHTAANYHLIHAVALVAIALAASRARASRGLALAFWLLGGGVLVFSGTLYAMALTDVRVLGAITPVGGTALIAGWIALAVAGARRRLFDGSPS
jgi:uncharacterized membrane protein YgdD (TMEM256/DUF423 family)